MSIETFYSLGQLVDFLTPHFANDANFVLKLDVSVFKNKQEYYPLFDQVSVNIPDIDQLVYFDYGGANEGPTTRVGYVLEVSNTSVLLYDLSVNGIRRFNRNQIDGLTVLEEIQDVEMVNPVKPPIPAVYNEKSFILWSELQKDDLIHFNYENPHNGSEYRVGFFVQDQLTSILIYDLTVDNYRAFNKHYINGVCRLEAV